MQKDYSLNALNQFLDWAAAKGLMNKNTSTSRKLAVNKVLSVLDEGEVLDLRTINPDDVFARFETLKGMDFKPASLRVYQSRMNSALGDFLEYVDNPSGFRPKKPRNQRNRGSNGDVEKSNQKASTPAAERVSYIESTNRQVTGNVMQNTINVPIPLREGLIVDVSRLPFDLTKKEAARIASVISAYALEDEGGK